MAKTKEEILNNYNGEHGYDIVRIVSADQHYGVNMQKEPLLSPIVCLAAMDEYAKQEAIEFAGWVVNEGYEVHAIDVWMKINDTGSAPILNRNQLYQQYLNSKTK